MAKGGRFGGGLGAEMERCSLKKTVLQAPKGGALEVPSKTQKMLSSMSGAMDLASFWEASQQKGFFDPPILPFFCYKKYFQMLTLIFVEGFMNQLRLGSTISIALFQ